MSTIDAQLQALLDTEIQKKHTHAILLGVQSTDKQVDFRGTVGGVSIDSPYFIASTSKLYTIAMLMQLVDEGKLSLDAPVSDYLPAHLVDGIHVFKGVDYSHQLKVYQLMHHTSGLPDYFQGSSNNVNSVMDDTKRGIDRSYTVDDVVTIARTMTPEFEPDTNNGRKSYYSDTNYQLLGAILEHVTQKSQQENLQTRISQPLNLAGTYFYEHDNLKGPQQPVLFYNQDLELNVPLMMSSELGAGGIVSTLADSLRFIQAYCAGELFDVSHFERMTVQWNNFTFPIQYGYGVMRYQLPRWLTLFRYTPALIGHSGASGAFCFHAPKEGISLAGTLNQVDAPARSFRLMSRVMNIVG